jgi:hypothetical protein
VRGLIIRVTGALGTIVTVIAYLRAPGLSFAPPSVAGLGVVIALALVGAGLDVEHWWTTRPKRYPPNDSRIVKYLEGWLSSGGRTAIFSRDMSWASDATVASVLQRKARAAELVLCVAAPSVFADNLRLAGASVYSYRALRMEPSARFTIVDYNSASARVAIGVVEGGKHTIREFSGSDKIIMALVTDLVEFARKAATP